MLFNSAEMSSRRQFHELFCTKFLYTGPSQGALNDASWNANVLCDILHALHEDNQLRPEDIETILQISGMYDSKGELFFHYNAYTPMLEDIVTAMSPFITQGAYVRCKQRMNGRDHDTIASFMTACCTNVQIKAERIAAMDLYDKYRTWCANHNALQVSRRVFYARMIELGYKRKRGYMHGTSGVAYFTISLDESEVNKVVRQQEDERTDSGQPIWYVDRPGEKVSTVLVEEETASVPVNEAAGPGEGGYGEVNEEYEATGTEYTSPDAVIPVDDDGFDWGADDDSDDTSDITESRLTADEPGPIEGDHSTSEDRELTAKERVAKLPNDVRNVFKMMKITYRISPDHFTQEEFEQSVTSMGIKDPENLFELFIKYAQGK